ncbi:acyl-CoA desaturase [Rhodocytophaga rosea]|uniref:Acyl-CoA desaturase n=1 Tax=Rhodocytophaga rosea TaxID=2704465 RepID=A0A6C0GBJ6_9BACT|nr:acyl-CoA desaturase [Rhodocytophaga rosea]QHT65311.1 acyl-CoA desaturase [Rhodocytophaga rosea]
MLKIKPKRHVKFSAASKSLFFSTLKKRVDFYFKEKNVSIHANKKMIVKSIILLALYVTPFLCILLLQPPFLMGLVFWLVMGLGLAGIGMSVMHDANHSAFSAIKWVNSVIGYSLNLVGGSVFNWKLQHNILHHTYTNIVGMDEDIEDRLVLRFSPHTKVKFYHRLQWIYAFMFYGILTLYWVSLKDFIQFFKYIKSGLNSHSPGENILIFTKILAIKLVYFFCMLIAPTLFWGIPFYQILTGFLLMHFVGGIILTTVFQLAHTVEGTSHPLPDEKGTIENEWAIHQLNTTVNFSRESKWISWYVGGLNFQIEHHLFPKICHVHYPQIAKIVKHTAEEYNINYLENKTFYQALRSHLTTLHHLGRLPNINEALV